MENEIPFNKENFDYLVKHNAQMFDALKGIINGCVHPKVAIRAVMVDLKPIREILEKIEKHEK